MDSEISICKPTKASAGRWLPNQTRLEHFETAQPGTFAMKQLQTTPIPPKSSFIKVPPTTRHPYPGPP
jgi:hypothetical protein